MDVEITLMNMFHTYKIPHEIWGSRDFDGGHSSLWYLLPAGAIIRIGYVLEGLGVMEVR